MINSVGYRFSVIFDGTEEVDKDGNLVYDTFNETIGVLKELEERGIVLEWDFEYTYRDFENKS